MGFLKIFLFKKQKSLEKLIPLKTINKTDIIHRINHAIDEACLAEGSVEEFIAGQKDFSSWGSGYILGSKNTVVEKLAEHLVAIQPNFLWIEPAKNWDWQQSNLEGFCLHIDASLAGSKAGFYLGKFPQETFGVFGHGINEVEREFQQLSF
ncbi:MAG: hypothetical protein ACOY90_02505 [Candidatus Zhuqueibacterota bacterium]